MNLQTSLQHTLIAAAFGAALMATTASHAAVTISTDATKNLNCSGGVCSPTDKTANLNVGDLQAMLASSDVTVKTGSGAISIGVATPLTWTSTHRLTLDSVQFIHIKAAVVIEGTGALTLTTNDGGTGGDLIFENGGYVNFWDLNSNLRVNGQSYVLVGDIHTLASDIAIDPAGYFALAKTYDASLDGTYSTAPIPTKFKGTLEGLGNTISNLTIVSSGSAQTNLALFALSSGRLRDFNLTNAFVSDTTAGGSFAAPLAATNLGRIEWVNASGKVSGTNSFMLGGLVAANGSIGEDSGGSIFHATSSVTVEGTAGSAGGITGYNSGAIRWSHASGAVHALYYAGGLAADTAEGTISQSFASGPVTVAAKGGAAGGLVGALGISTSGANILEQSYATGKVGGSLDGGLVGLAESGTISQCYAAGRVANRKSSGGFIGSVDDTFPPPDFTADYWNKTTSRQDQGTGSGDFDGLTGLTGAQLKSALPAGFDKKVWGQNPDINHGWPYLLANPPQ